MFFFTTVSQLHLVKESFERSRSLRLSLALFWCFYCGLWTSKYRLEKFQLTNLYYVRDTILHIAWKLSKYAGFSGPYFPVFSLNTGKYGPEKSPSLDTFHAMSVPILTHFWSMFPFYAPWKRQKTKGFLLFFRGMKWELCP